MKKPRRVYGRRRVKCDGSVFIVELRKDGIYSRELRSPREKSMTLGELVDALNGQQIIRMSK
jgi:hypothetical protein